MLVSVVIPYESLLTDDVGVASELLVHVAAELSGWYCCHTSVGAGNDVQLHDMLTLLPAPTGVLHVGAVTFSESV